MLLPNRIVAGKELAERLTGHLPALAEWAEANMVVVGLPRGGVPVALEVARKFNCRLEVLVAKKLSFPGQAEYAIGAVSSDGIIVLNPDIPREGAWKHYVEQQKQELKKRTAGMEESYYKGAGERHHSLKNKTVVVVDDGIATGMTALAALQTVKKRGASYVILAAPVISLEAFENLRQHCHYIVALKTPRNFGSVGQHYLDFEQTTNEEVIAALRQNNKLALL